MARQTDRTQSDRPKAPPTQKNNDHKMTRTKMQKHGNSPILTLGFPPRLIAGAEIDRSTKCEHIDKNLTVFQGSRPHATPAPPPNTKPPKHTIARTKTNKKPGNSPALTLGVPPRLSAGAELDGLFAGERYSNTSTPTTP